MTTHDLVFRGARVIDPETGLDDVRDVAVTGTTITAVAAPDDDVHGRVVVEAHGNVLAPGFIDLHSHCRDLPSLWLQVSDGVTTTLELEAGELNVDHAYAEAAAEGRPLNYGFSASWALARMATCGLTVTPGVDSFSANIDAPAWHRPLTAREQDQLLDALGRDLAAGALGVGVLLGYCEESDASEYLAVAALAAASGVPTFTHVRELARPDAGLLGAQEVVTAAVTTGAHMHLCHVNSTSTRHVDDVHALLGRAREQGLRVTAEAYPYGAGATAIGAAFLDPSSLPSFNLEPADICYLPTGERPTTNARLAELRALDPAGMAVIDFLKERDPDDLGFLTRALLADDTAVASDAMPLVAPGAQPGSTPEWPLAPGVMTHPRTAGTFSRVLRWYVRELGILTLPEAIRRCTLVPAEILRDVAPVMARKGRIQVGADADIVVFDPETVTDQATYDQPVWTSTGIAHVLVDGAFVVRDGILDTDSRPGHPIRGTTE